jgi:hypothetical protein
MDRFQLFLGQCCRWQLFRYRRCLVVAAAVTALLLLHHYLKM